MRQIKIHLTEDDSAALKAFRSKGYRLAREVNRAHILLALDEKVPEAHIMQVLGGLLNMAEIDIGVMDRQCIGGRLTSEAMLKSEVSAWKHRRNQAQTRIKWKFTRQDTDHKLSRHYVS